MDDAFSEFKLTPKKLLASILLGITLLVVLVVIFSIKTINPGQAAVATRFGSLNGVRNSGTYLALFEGYTVYDLKDKKVEARYEAGSAEQQFVFVTSAFTYQLQSDKLQSLFSTVGSQQDLEDKIINPLLSDVVKYATAQYKATEVLQKQKELRTDIIKLIKERLSEEYITFKDFQIINIDFTDQYNQALEQKQIAEQNAIKDRQVAEQNTKKAQAELETVKVEAQKKIEAAKGDAEAQRLIQQSITSELLRQQWIQKWNGQLPTTLSDGDIQLLLGLK